MGLPYRYGTSHWAVRHRVWSGGPLQAPTVALETRSCGGQWFCSTAPPPLRPDGANDTRCSNGKYFPPCAMPHLKVQREFAVTWGGIPVCCQGGGSSSGVSEYITTRGGSVGSSSVSYPVLTSARAAGPRPSHSQHISSCNSNIYLNETQLFSH